MKIAKQRIIYSSFDLDEQYPDEEMRDLASANGNDDPSDDELQQWRYQENEWAYEEANQELVAFFDGLDVEISGTLGLWDGTHKIKKQVGSFVNLFDRAIRDAYDFKLYDENGHFYILVGHHDGNNKFEIKIVTNKGYTTLPRFAEKVYGCKAREYEESTKEKLINMVNNMARSNYA
jgi:hypothetical protein